MPKKGGDPGDFSGYSGRLIGILSDLLSSRDIGDGDSYGHSNGEWMQLVPDCVPNEIVERDRFDHFAWSLRAYAIFSTS